MELAGELIKSSIDDSSLINNSAENLVTVFDNNLNNLEMELEVLRVGSNLVDFNLISHSFYSFLFNPSHYLDIDICYIIFINLNLQFL